MKRLGNPSFRSVKRPKRSIRCILWLWKSRETSSGVQQFKGMQSSKLGRWTATGYHLSLEGIQKGTLSIKNGTKWKGWTTGQSLKKRTHPCLSLAESTIMPFNVYIFFFRWPKSEDKSVPWFYPSFTMTSPITSLFRLRLSYTTF